MENSKFRPKQGKETQLKQYLNINPDDQFVFINNNFAGPEYSYKVDIKPETNLRIVYQEYIDGLHYWTGAEY
jgi:hypothetical protein